MTTQNTGFIHLKPWTTNPFESAHNNKNNKCERMWEALWKVVHKKSIQSQHIDNQTSSPAPSASAALKLSANIRSLFCICLSTATIYKPKQENEGNIINSAIKQYLLSKKQKKEKSARHTECASNRTEPEHPHGPLIPESSSASHDYYLQKHHQNVFSIKASFIIY